MAHAHQHALPKGYRLGRYSIEAVLGAGGFAITYLAQHTGLDQKVAIKEYLPDEFALRIEGRTTVRAIRGEEDEFSWGLNRFADEARTLAKFNHPSIVPVTDFFEANGTAHMVMPYQEGESLEERLARDGTLPEPVLRMLFDPLIDALELVHASDILHRDIKPANIFIRSDGAPMLLDFGNARQALGTKSQSLTATLTPGYAPNEQYSTHGKQGPWSDVYSLGATLYKAAVGNTPPEAPDRAIEDSYVPAAIAAEGKYAPSLLSAIDKSLTFKPSERPRDMAAFKRLMDRPKGADKTALPPSQEAANATLLVKERQSTDRRARVAGLKWAKAGLLATVIIGSSYWGWTRYQEIEHQQNEFVRAKLRAQDAELAKREAERIEAKRQAVGAEVKRRAAIEAKRQAEEARRKAAAVAKRKATVAAAAKRKAAVAAAAKRKAAVAAVAKRQTAAALNAQRVANTAPAYNSRGNAYSILKQYRRAIVELDQEIRVNPRNVTAYVNRAHNYSFLKQYRRAIADLDEVIRLNPRHALAYARRSYAYVMLGMFKQTIADANQAIQINPRDALAYNNRGMAYQHLGYHQNALHDYRMALKIDPNHKLARKNLEGLNYVR